MGPLMTAPLHWRGDWLAKAAAAKRQRRKAPPVVRIGGARQVMRWPWSKWYRSAVTAQCAAQARWTLSPRYVDDYGDPSSEAVKYWNRTVLAICEARGIARWQIRSILPQDGPGMLAAVRLVKGPALVVNLAPRPRWSPEPLPFRQQGTFFDLWESDDERKTA